MTVNFNLPLIHQIILLISVVGIGIWLVWARNNRGRWLYAVAPLSYLFHVVIFYLVSMTNLFSPVDLDFWSDMIRIHGTILIILGALVIIGWRETKYSVEDFNPKDKKND